MITIKDMYAISAPGYFSAFSYMLFSGMYVWVNRRKYSVPRTIILQVLLTAAVTGLSYLVETPDKLTYVPRLLAFLALPVLCMKLTMEGSWKKCLYFMAFAFIQAEFTTALEWHMYYFGVNVKKVPDILTIRIPFFIGVYSLIYAGALLSNRGFREYNREMEVRTADAVQVWMLAVFIFLASNISNVFQETIFSSSEPGVIFQIRTLIDFTGVFAMHILHLAAKEADSRMRAERMQLMMDQMYENYKISKQSIAIVSEKYHDLKHQIQWLREGQNSEEANAALDRVEDEIRDFEAQANTGNEILDTILMSARLNSRNDQVVITCIADGRLLSGFDKMDVSALFGNLMDNALEAVKEIPEPEKRLINLTVEEKKGFLVIACENRCEGERIIREGIPVTSKQDTNYHGFGTQSIRRIAEKYGGTAVFSANDGWFRTKIVIPK